MPSLPVLAMYLPDSCFRICSATVSQLLVSSLASPIPCVANLLKWLRSMRLNHIQSDDSLSGTEQTENKINKYIGQA